jgi:hypothetical protein
MAYGNEGGENVKFKHQKKNLILKLKINIHWSNVFSFQISFYNFNIHTHSSLNNSK